MGIYRMKNIMTLGLMGLLYLGCSSNEVIDKGIEKTKNLETQTLELEVEKHNGISLEGRSA
ncbi:hypothetical protein GF361_00255, partial [Candidatus Woesearchaeota archaeon]|nr:hypothetical protein [Candidatus Woesearchaeota archaeon]